MAEGSTCNLKGSVGLNYVMAMSMAAARKEEARKTQIRFLVKRIKCQRRALHNHEDYIVRASKSRWYWMRRAYEVERELRCHTTIWSRLSRSLRGKLKIGFITVLTSSALGGLLIHFFRV